MNLRCAEYLKNQPGLIWRIPIGFLVWFSFVKLPATATLNQLTQPWEAVLSYAVTRHMQWGQDIVFTYGPLGFLISGFYWGNHFWPILLWSFGFSLWLTILTLRFLDRLILPRRIILCIALPLLTVPRCSDLGIDPVYLFAITVCGIACLPEERPGVTWLMVSGSILGCLSLIKFTFCLYAILALLIITAAHLFYRRRWPAGVAIGSYGVAFLVAWLITGQHLFHIGLWFCRSLHVASGYASAMTIAPFESDWVLGMLACLSLVGLLGVHGRGAGGRLARTPGICLLAAGLFLAWNEGFVRADDVHVIVFLLYAFLMAATMPALLGASGKRHILFLSLSVAALAFALAPFVMQESAYLTDIKIGVLPKVTDTFTALFRPETFKRRLEAHLESRRSRMLLPRIAAMVGQAPVGVLNYDQHVAILNGLNYRPHPIFQSYSAYTPKLQRLNSDFFDSAEAPEYVLWRYGTVDLRFPTLDDGRVILTLLGAYAPVTKEKDYVLWKRNAAGGRGYAFVGREEVNEHLDRWFPLPGRPTWLRIELRETWFGTVRKFFCRASVPAIEVRLEDGRKLKYRLLPGNASSGFIVNPLLESEADLVRPFLKEGKVLRMTEARIYAKKWCWNDSIHLVMEKIEGAPALDNEPDAVPAPAISVLPPATAP